MAGELPVVSVAIAWDSGFSTPIASRTYTDVSAYVDGDAGVSINYGRADERSTVDPSTCTLTLNNADGRFTPEKASSPYYPNVKKGKPIQVSLRYPSHGAGNLLSVNQASMETSVADWSMVGGGTSALSSTHALVGSKALLVTWPTAVVPYVKTQVAGLVVGRSYTFSASVFVAAGSPAVKIGQEVGTQSAASSSTGVWQRLSVTFVATVATQNLIVVPASSPTSGQQVWVDAVMLDEGTTLSAFTTSPAPIFRRFTGYVDEWPLTWPTGSDATANMSITCSSRRARLGKGAPLPSAIRDAYLKTSPDAYWPMDEGLDITDQAGRLAYRDITNSGPWVDTQVLAAFANSVPLLLIIDDGTPGPTDEASLVKFPTFSDPALIGTFAHYVGSGNTVKINTAGELTIEAVCRLKPHPSDTAPSSASIFQIRSANLLQAIEVTVTTAFSGMTAEMLLRSPTNFAVLDDQLDYYYANGEYDTATDGEIHHYAVTLTGANTLDAYMDGVHKGTLTLSAGFTFDTPLTALAFGSDTFNMDAWIGHAAIHDRALSAAEVAAHAVGALTATETVQQRLQRLAGYLGVPASEVSAEASVAAAVGPQKQKGRGAVEVIDELAATTSGIAYDRRDGTFYMQARNHRYNQSAAFTLSASAGEIEPDAATAYDDRYLWNTVEITHGDDVPTTAVDDASVEEYGPANPGAFEMVTTSNEEVAAAAANILFLYAEPTTRINTLSVDVMDLSSVQQKLVLAADIGTLFNAASLPFQAPTDPMPLYIEGYAESISKDGHAMTLNTTRGDLHTNVAVTNDPAHDMTNSGITTAY